MEQNAGLPLGKRCERAIEIGRGSGLDDIENPAVGARRASISATLGAEFGLSGFTSSPTVTASGTSLRNRSRRFPNSSLLITVTPVMFPPGRLRLSTRPNSTGSEPNPKTIGMVAVAALAANGARTEPIATITATRR